jgi:hypothetical protein
MSHADPLQRPLAALTDIFRRVRDKREAHRQSRAILGDMTTDPSGVTAIFRRHLEAPAALNARHYPVVSVMVEENPFYTLVANCWIPLPDGATDVTTKAIHHHGTMLLTTATAFGPGYEHWTFTPPQVADPERELYTMRTVGHEPHPLHHVDFVDAHFAHVPLFPPTLSITLALWSSSSETTWRDVVKRLPAFRGHEAALRRLAARVGLARALDLKTVEYFDFYPTTEGFKGMRERIEFERGPNTDYLQSVFHILQATGNDALAPVVESRLEADRWVENRGFVKGLLGHLRQGRPIPGCLSSGHYGVPYANFRRADIERALAEQTARAPSGRPG